VTDAELAALLRRSAVHALPSWGDLPGFVSLERGRAVRAWLPARAVPSASSSALTPPYVDPLDPDAIRAAVLQALEQPPAQPRGRTRTRGCAACAGTPYAERALDAYTRAVGGSRSGEGPVSA